MQLLDIAAHSAEFGFADPRTVDEGFDGFDLDDAEDPAVDAKDAVVVDGNTVDSELHRRLADRQHVGGSSVRGINHFNGHRLRRDRNPQPLLADFAVGGAHGQQRLDRAARRARQIEGENKAATRGCGALGIEPGNIRPRQTVSGGADCFLVDRDADFGDRGLRQRPAAYRKLRGSIGDANNSERLDRDQDRRLAGRVRRTRPPGGSRFAAGLLAPRPETARGADPEVMQKRVVRLLSAQPALIEVKPGVEIGIGIAALARPLLQVMDQWIDVALCDIRVGHQIVFGVKQPGFSYIFVVAEQCFHQSGIRSHPSAQITPPPGLSRGSTSLVVSEC